MYNIVLHTAHGMQVSVILNLTYKFNFLTIPSLQTRSPMSYIRSVVSRIVPNLYVGLVNNH